jgi:hypothetical protein
VKPAINPDTSTLHTSPQKQAASPRRRKINLMQAIYLHSEHHTEHINTLYGQNILYFNVKLGVSYSIHTVERSKASVYVRSLAGITGSNPAGDMDVCCECCVLSGRGLCDGLIPRPEESYRLWCAIVYDLKKSSMRRPWPLLGCCVRNNNASKVQL